MCIELYIIISSEWVADILGCQLHIGQLWSVVVRSGQLCIG